MSDSESSNDEFPRAEIDDDSSVEPEIPKEMPKEIPKEIPEPKPCDVKPKKERTPKQKAAWERCLAANKKRREEAKKLKEEKLNK